MMLNDDEIFAKGLKVLVEGIGDLEAEKFIALVNRNKFNYTEWRRENLFKDITPEEFNKSAIEYAKTHHLE